MDIAAISGSINTVGYGISVIGAGIGVGIIFGLGMQAIARQPEARGPLQTNIYLGMALVEALAILGFVLAFAVN
ncbi:MULTISPECIES: ATP synthase F0 subunit C [Nocardiopsis]|jgi:F-type H+-transporting ATPase subunit c|uniref:ATP synthase subunit c n=2 Tax=Nocardiopsis alba TaxID=53437 RepID=A0A7K2IVQ9_9ACTN|nr:MULTISPECIES: ATP synthase F0 subunit C [Nocardiopsis]AFR09149.1 ATP synthase F0, C subunit [Nocardiopsis alba ATCC BAA-2165]MEC3894939.1 ATP synthase F0 subunit C [Nocardiopsis sp. LDBS1602]MYR33937.1 ATP synthase F0 subunit C [Nocardiopsis alba]